MRRYRRLMLIDRLIPFLAALVGLVALAGAVMVQLNTDVKTRALAEAVSTLRDAVDVAATPAAVQLKPMDDGSAAALTALEERIAELEATVSAQQAASVTAAAEPAPEAETETAAIDPNLPTTDCIPLGTRFMVIPNESFPICQSKVVLKTGMISDDAVSFAQTGDVVETSLAAIPGSSCSVMVFSADAAGFAEVRVTCT